MNDEKFIDICDAWSTLKDKIYEHRSTYERDEDDLDILVDHDLDINNHINWSIPITMYQLSENKKEHIENLIKQYGYETLLFMLAYLYIKYHNDNSIYFTQVDWQWEHICPDECYRDFNLVNEIERELLVAMDYQPDKWCMGSGDIFEEYYKKNCSEHKKKTMIKCMSSQELL
jgi:hypothetical protein